jgi:hypothetical protein
VGRQADLKNEEPAAPPVVLSHFQAAALLAALRSGRPAMRVSPDLNLTTVDVLLDADGACFPDGSRCSPAELEEIVADRNGCFELTSTGLARIQTFSSETGRVYSLFPTSGAPTMLLSGIPMHRIKDTDPYRDTLSKLRAAGGTGGRAGDRTAGRVLDTCTGLGYTALEAARTATEVVTVELDPAVHEIIRRNPWSRRLFTTPNVSCLIGDSAEEIQSFLAESFDLIVHDPPMLSLAGDLYSLAFYRSAWRALRRGGRMFHYIGNPESKSAGAITRGVVQRLREAGFRRVDDRRAAFGVLATK